MTLYSAVALFLLPAVLAGTVASLDVSSPLILWSNKGVLGEGKQVSYQVLPKVEEVATDFVLSAFGKAGEESSARLQSIVNGALDAEESRTVIVFLGSQLDAADMRSGVDAVRSLDSVVTGATSSLVMPYATSQGASIRDAVSSKLEQAGVQHEVVGCSTPSMDLKVDVSAVLAKGSARAVIVCSHLEPALQNTNAGLAMEVEQLLAVQSAVDAASGSHVFVYASQAAGTGAIASDNGKRRSLLQDTLTGFGDYTVCGTLCQTQVRWLEGMLAVIFLALASCAGLVCLYVLDTPTRFESPKEAAPQQS